MLKRVVLAAFVASALTLGPATARADVKVGFLGSLSGPLAVVGQDQLDGFLLALEQLGGKFGGQPVTVVKEDDQLKPEVGTQAVRKLIERESVDVIVGLGPSNIVMAATPRVIEAGTPAILTQAGPSPVAGSSCAPNVFSVAWQNDGAAEAIGKFMQDKGIKRVYLAAPNFQAGKDMLAGFKRYYKGEVVDEVYTQLNQSDYAGELAQMQAAKPDAVFAFFPGALGVNFVRQMSQAGLLAKIPLYSVFTVDGTTMPALGDAAVGTFSGAMWDVALDSAENKRFVSAFEAKFKRVPSEYAAAGYDAANLLDAAVRKAGRNTNDKKAFVAAIKAAGAEFRSVRGPFRFNNNNLPIQNYYAFQVVKEGGKVTVKYIDTPLKEHRDAYAGKCPLK